MGPVWQNPIQRTVRTAHLSVLMTVQSFSIQYKTENLPSYLQTNIIAQMLSIRGEEGLVKQTAINNKSSATAEMADHHAMAVKQTRLDWAIQNVKLQRNKSKLKISEVWGGGKSFAPVILKIKHQGSIWLMQVHP